MNTTIRMARRGVAVVALVALTSATALAEDAAAPAGDPSVIAMLDAMLTLCTPVEGSARAVAALQAQLKQASQGLSEAGLATLRESDSYQSALSAMTESLGGLDEQGTKQTCGIAPAAKP